MFSNYTELDLRHLFDIYTQNEDVETNPVNLANINSKYCDVHHILYTLR